MTGIQTMAIKNALIVDDSRSARVMLQRLLEKMNVVSLAVESAEEAIEYLEEQRPDVIFMDHMMPGMDGLEATQTIKNNPKTKSIPTIMYTSKEGDGYNTLAKSHGASGVLPKPADQQAVMAVIDSLSNHAANDMPTSNTTPDTVITLEQVERLIKSRFNSSILSAKAEISAGLDGVSHQLVQTQEERLVIAERRLKQQLEPLQTKIAALNNDNDLFKRLQPQIQKQALVIADKLARKKVDELKLSTELKFNALQENQVEQLAEIHKHIANAKFSGAILGTIFGSSIAIMAYFLLR
jgi:CheY-like chemotaxis protein